MLTETTHKGMVEGVKREVESVAKDLEYVTSVLDENLSSLEASKMPEYRAATKAIRVYKTALGNRMNSLHNEGRESKSRTRQ